MSWLATRSCDRDACAEFGEETATKPEEGVDDDGHSCEETPMLRGSGAERRPRRETRHPLWRPVAVASTFAAVAALSWRGLLITWPRAAIADRISQLLVVKKEWEPVNWGPLPFTIEVIYIPESHKDERRILDLRREYQKYVYIGYTFLSVPGVDTKYWPDGGRYHKYRNVTVQLGAASGTPHPWWRAISDQDPQEQIDKGFGHHVGCEGSHFMLWWFARQQSVQNLLVSESDAGPWRFSLGTHGCPSDFPGVAKKAVEEAPPGWHIIQLDKGKAGAKPEITRVLHVPDASTDYTMHQWIGRGVAGAGLYVVSRKFLDELPQILKIHKLIMLDAWIGWLCGDGTLECYSVDAYVHQQQHTCPHKKVIA